MLWLPFVVLVALELALAFTIRDNLFLTVLQLKFPTET